MSRQAIDYAGRLPLMMRSQPFSGLYFRFRQTQTSRYWFALVIVISVISGGANRRIGGPQVPVPRLT